MMDTKLRCAIGGSLLFGAGLTAWAEDPAILRRDVQASEQSEFAVPPGPRDAAPPAEEPLNQVRSISPAPIECPPSQSSRPGFFVRFKQHCRAKYWGYPEEFYEPPLGSMVLSYQMTQIANGQAGRMGVYQYDFLPDSAQLSARGKAQVCKIASRVSINNFPVFVESTVTDPNLDELRRQTVFSELSGYCHSIPSDRVIVGSPNIHSIGAVEGLLIDRNRVNLTGQRGVSASGGGTSGTSTSSAGTTAR